MCELTPLIHGEAEATYLRANGREANVKVDPLGLMVADGRRSSVEAPGGGEGRFFRMVKPAPAELFRDAELTLRSYASA